MAEFSGYLLHGKKSNTHFPSSLIKMGTWEGTPRQREYIKAYRDDNTRNLTKVASKGRKSTFKFTVPKINLAQRKVIQQFINENTINDDGDLSLKYWDDQDLVYREGSFYCPNLTFKIIKHSDTDIEYDELTLEFIEN